MKVEIPRDIRGLITRSHPAALNTQIPAGPNFDGAPDEVAINGHVEVRWDCATPPKGSLHFRFTADDSADAGLLTRFNGYFDRCRALVAAQGPGFPAGHVVLTIHDSSSNANERGAGFCDGLPQFNRVGRKWIMDDSLERLWCAASELDGSKPAKLCSISWDPNLGKLMDRLGFSVTLDKVGMLEIGKAAINAFFLTIFFAAPASASLDLDCVSPAHAISDGAVTVDALYRVELVIPTPPQEIGAEILASTLFAALSFASGFYMDFAGTVIVQEGRAIYSELKPCQGGAPEPFCPPIDWTESGASGTAAIPATTSYGTRVAEIASLFFRRVAVDIPMIGGGPRVLYTHPLVGVMSELRDAMCAGPIGDLYLATKRAYVIMPAAIEMIAKCYKLDSSGHVSWQPLRPSGNRTMDNTAKNDRIKRLVGDDTFKFWGKIRNPLAHELKLMENSPPDAAPGGSPSGYSMRGFLSERGQEVNARLRDLCKLERFLLTMFNYAVLRIIGYTGDATNWADKNRRAYRVSGGNAPAPQANDFETQFARDNWV